jgi:hypothetical protein
MRLLLAFLPALACAGLMYGCIRMMLPHRKTDVPDPEVTTLRIHVAELERRLEDLEVDGRSAPAQQER